ncbi:MAG: hypothetical protein CL908_16705 [Deltaproteobacteria bacterium]|nr:hypothetical protein [Deltaproteobacteria bacterium]
MRLLLVGAFPYPHDQGSQVYFQEQAIALREAGAEVSLLTYASGRRPEAGRDPARGRALDGFDHQTSPGWTAPASLRSGPGWGKPLGDLGLAMTLHDAVASRSPRDAYDAILTHNAEATGVALQTLRGARPPIVYCAHTLLGVELSSYLKQPKQAQNQDDPGRSHNARQGRGPIPGLLDGLGRRVDRWLGRRVDGWIALTQSAASVMRQCSTRPGSVIPPPVPDPRQQAEPLEPKRVARRQGLVAGEYFLYSGNLDGYQELELLVAAGERLGSAAPTIVLASHDDRLASRRAALPGLTLRAIGSAGEMQALIAGARASLVTRRAEGGFPIKLANSLAMGTPPIALLGQEWGLVDGENALIGRLHEPVASIAAAIARLASDDALAQQLSAGARALYLAGHRPQGCAEQTLALIERVVAHRGGAGASGDG